MARVSAPLGIANASSFRGALPLCGGNRPPSSRRPARALCREWLLLSGGNVFLGEATAANECSTGEPRGVHHSGAPAHRRRCWVARRLIRQTLAARGCILHAAKRLPPAPACTNLPLPPFPPALFLCFPFSPQPVNVDIVGTESINPRFRRSFYFPLHTTASLL
jgi:hypothetical protein